MAEGGQEMKGTNPNSKDGDMDAEIQRLKDEGFFRMGKACTGCLLYSSFLRRFNSGNPVCLGFSCTEIVPGSYYGKPEMNVTKDFHFIYACLGESLYVDDMQHQREAPICIAGYQAYYAKEKATDSDSFTRFKRNANVAASEVAQNVRKVGRQIKEKIDDILRPPPK
ncbi:unnamed protein product [Lactuca saligna]|uniref:DUF8204 domain-containing protein n=1 Tax=Lactuca saligna TaxID=75948 RepID=A0AA35VIE1_LACSI|nr:unnamed protein product [Lactuca saligna]